MRDFYQKTSDFFKRRVKETDFEIFLYPVSIFLFDGCRGFICPVNQDVIS